MRPGRSSRLRQLRGSVDNPDMKSDANHPDAIVLAKRCRTFANPRRPAEALAIRRGRIAAIGTTREIRALKKLGTRVIDLAGATVTPGLVDCHTHFLFWAISRAYTIDLAACRSKAETLERLRRLAPKHAIGEWIVGMGFNHNLWPDGSPSSVDLDPLFPDRPVVLRSRDTHMAWLNSAALRRAGIGPDTPDPKDGCYGRDARGRVNGTVFEKAVERLPDPIAEIAARVDAQALRIVDRALEEAYCTAWSLGLTGVHTVDGALSLKHMQRHRRAGRLGMRVLHGVPLENLQHAKALGLRSGLGDEWLRIGGIKIFSDGSLGANTAFMYDPYPGGGGNRGVPVIVGDELKEAAVDAARHGWALWIHAIGDRAVHDVIEALAAARKVEETRLPHRIEHVQCARPADIRRIGRLGLIASMQPCHIMGDIRTAERLWPKASRNAFAFQSLRAAGVTLALGSDVPVESNDPRRGLFGAAVRTDLDGYPAGGWYADQRLTVEQALYGYTRGAAACLGGSASGGGEAAPSGTLEVGAPADLTIWYDDPLEAAGDELLKLRIGGCMIGGELHLDA
jgi:predicted amidohydrolase YtcJ